MLKLTALTALLFSFSPLHARNWPPSLALDSAPAAPAVKAAAPAEWTVMYFINSKNNLESSGMMDMNQLELVGSNESVRITVELGRMSGQEGDDHSEGDWTGVRRYLVARDADTSRIASPVLEDRGRADMGSWKELVSFIRWSKENYPARRYALVLWDHGNGWKPVDSANSGDFGNLKGFSLDDETGHEFSIPQIAEALRVTGGVNFLMLDGCNMGMASVAYELKDQAEALTASEETEPGVVVRYAQFLRLLNARPFMGAEEFAANTVRTYRDYFINAGGDPEGAPVTQSALRLGRMAAFRGKLDAWALAAMNAERPVLLQAKAKAKVFGEDPDYRDLYDFVRLVTEGTRSPALKTAGREVMNSLKQELVIENWAQDAVSHGVSIYVPATFYHPLYGGLAFARDGRWDDFARFIAGLK
ncbi:MAG: clostripain-related cysteine peptidase [Elusimicrobiales bacterium]|nr:clostripain-related cysteine peptidase [Elusimicrobiales bacterium]